MKRIFIAMLVLLTPALALAGHSVEERLETLENKQAELYHTLAEKKDAGLKSAIAEKITLSGLVEVEAVLEEVENTDGTTDAESDIALATAQLGFGAEIAEGISSDIILLFEDGEDFLVDEAVIGFENDTWFGTVGLQYVPFGVFHSHFISDPLTLELGESQETAVLGGYGTDMVSVSAYVFNGDAEKTSEAEDHIRDWGIALDVTPAEGLALGASYISDLADSDAEIVGGTYADRVGGFSAYFAYAPGSFDITGEVLGAATDFAAADLDADGDGSGDQPLTWNLEFAYAASDALELALRYEGSDELEEAPEAQYGFCASWGVRQNVVLSLEYLRGEFDEDFGAGADSRNLVTAQLGLEF